MIIKGGSGGTPSTSVSEYYLGNIPFLSITDITNSDGYIYDTEKHITDDALYNSSAWIVPAESISLAMYASVGKVAILKQNTATSQAFYNLVFDNNILRDYIFQYLKKMETLNQWTALISTGTQANLNADKVKKLIISIPKNIDEQCHIGKILIYIDNLITLHQRKFEALSNIKKALLEKMFPSNGEVTPKIRFAGFTEAWEQCELTKLGKIETGNTPSTAIEEYYSDTGLLWVTPTDIISNIIVNTDKKLTTKGIAVARVIPANSILCTCIASIGKNAFLPVKCAFNQQINALTPFENNDPYFLFTNSYHWSQTMKKGAGGLTFQIVNKTEFSNIKTLVPEYVEQKKIGQLFYKLDNLITLHQRKCIFLKFIISHFF